MGTFGIKCLFHTTDGTFDRYRKDSFYWYQKCIVTNGEDLD